MTIHTFLSRRSRFANTLSVLLALLMLLPSLAGFAKPMQSAAASPSGDPVDRLKVGDVIWAKSNATGKAEWKQIIHSSKRTVPALLNVRLINAKTGKTAAELTCPLDEKVTLNNGKRIPAARLAVGNSIITRAGPVCRVTAMWLLKRPGGFVLSDVRVGPLSVAQAKRLAALHSTQARLQPALNFAGYAAPASAGGDTLNPFLFQGQQFDPVSGDYYLRARYYDPTMGRFLSQDPFAGVDVDPVSLHRYLYASNDPVNKVDPNGLDDLGQLEAGLDVNAELAPTEVQASGPTTLAGLNATFGIPYGYAGTATPLLFSSVSGVALRRAAIVIAGGVLVSALGAGFGGSPDATQQVVDGGSDGHHIFGYHYSIIPPQQFAGSGLRGPSYITNADDLSPQAARATLLGGAKGLGPLQYRYTVVMADNNPLYPITFNPQALGVGVYEYFLINGSPPGSVTEVATYDYQTYQWTSRPFP